nr:MAG TPA: hypothetical protein [Caudoviricetes sp.]
MLPTLFQHGKCYVFSNLPVLPIGQRVFDVSADDISLSLSRIYDFQKIKLFGEFFIPSNCYFNMSIIS